MYLTCLLLFTHTSLLLLLKMRNHPVKKKRRRKKKKKVKKKKKTVKRSQSHHHTKMMDRLLMMWRPHKLSNQYSRLLPSNQPYHQWMIIRPLNNQLVSVDNCNSLLVVFPEWSCDCVSLFPLKLDHLFSITLVMAFRPLERLTTFTGVDTDAGNSFQKYIIMHEALSFC